MFSSLEQQQVVTEFQDMADMVEHVAKMLTKAKI